MTLDNMTGITKGSYTGFCKSQLITCNFVKACNGVCPFEDALKHADKMQTMNEQHTVDHDRDWIIGCIEHDGFIKTDRFDKANQIILDALQGWIPVSEKPPETGDSILVTYSDGEVGIVWSARPKVWGKYEKANNLIFPVAWMPLPQPYKAESEPKKVRIRNE